MAKNFEELISVLGEPSPPTPPGLTFPDYNGVWELIKEDALAGWFLDRFLYLFGEGLEALAPCLEAWSFVVPHPHEDRRIIGRNAYGAILVLEDENTIGKSSIHLLDPVHVDYRLVRNTTLLQLCGRALPRNEIPDFLDHGAYDAWRKQHPDAELGLDDVLGVKVPLSLGGTLTVDNLQLDGIVDYYQTTAPIYADAVAKKRK